MTELNDNTSKTNDLTKENIKNKDDIIFDIELENLDTSLNDDGFIDDLEIEEIFDIDFVTPDDELVDEINISELNDISDSHKKDMLSNVAQDLESIENEFIIEDELHSSEKGKAIEQDTYRFLKNLIELNGEDLNEDAVPTIEEIFENMSYEEITKEMKSEAEKLKIQSSPKTPDSAQQLVEEIKFDIPNLNKDMLYQSQADLIDQSVLSRISNLEEERSLEEEQKLNNLEPNTVSSFDNIIKNEIKIDSNVVENLMEKEIELSQKGSYEFSQTTLNENNLRLLDKIDLESDLDTIEEINTEEIFKEIEQDLKRKTISEEQKNAIPVVNTIIQPTQSQPATLNSNQVEDVKEILKFMDTLFGELPEDKIREFAKSKYFNLYNKIFDELGI